MNETTGTGRSDSSGVSTRVEAFLGFPVQRVWKIWLPIPLLLLLLDATFPFWFWEIPKLTGRSDDYGYQFQHDLHRLRTPPPMGTTRVLVFGSSVSSAFDQYQVQRLLDTKSDSGQIHVQRILSPGMKPSDYRTFFHAELESLNTPVVMYLFNWVDFFNPGFERDVKEGIRYLLPPWQVLRERASYLSVSSALDLVLAGTSNLYRYRKPIKSSIHDHVRLAVQWIRSDTGAGGYGVYPDGYTKRRFAIPADQLGGKLAFLIEPSWLDLQGAVTLKFKIDGRPVEQQVYRDPGWKVWSYDMVGAKLVEVETNSAWNRRAAGLGDDIRLVGVKLRQLPQGGATAERVPPREYPPIRPDEIEPFLKMDGTTGAAFQRRWNEVFSANTDFAIRFRKYREGKLTLKDQPFVVEDEFAEMKALVEELVQSGIRVVLVNTPENPWILEEYESGSYYQGYLRFFHGLAASRPGVEFHDLRDSLPVEDFNDWHHLTFIGDLKLGPRFTTIVQDTVRHLD